MQLVQVAPPSVVRSIVTVGIAPNSASRENEMRTETHVVADEHDIVEGIELPNWPPAEDGTSDQLAPPSPLER